MCTEHETFTLRRKIAELRLRLQLLIGRQENEAVSARSVRRSSGKWRQEGKRLAAPARAARPGDEDFLAVPVEVSAPGKFGGVGEQQGVQERRV
jgi:hypothetical protein